MINRITLAGLILLAAPLHASAQATYKFISTLVSIGQNSYDMGSSNYNGVLDSALQYGFVLTHFQPMPTAGNPTFIFTFTSLGDDGDTATLTTSRAGNKVTSTVVAYTKSKATFTSWKAGADADATWEHRRIQDNLWEYEYNHSSTFPRNCTLAMGVSYAPPIDFGKIPPYEEKAVDPATFTLKWVLPPP